MVHSWSQILIGGVLGAGLWSAIWGLSLAAPTPKAEEIPVAAVSVESESETAVPMPLPPPLPVEASPTPRPSPVTVAAAEPPPPPLPTLRGTMVGRSNLAIFEYQGMQRVVKEGETVGPFVVGGVYPKQASLSLQGKKFFIPLVPPTAFGNPAAPPRVTENRNSTEQWVKSLLATQVVREGTPVGLILRKTGDSKADDPLQTYGVYEGDIIKAVNGRPVRTQTDLWWVHQELLHAPRFELTVERGGQEQSLRQERLTGR